MRGLRKMSEEYTIYEYIYGNNSPASELRRIGDEKDFEREKEIREKGYGFFELYYSKKDVGEMATKRELDQAQED